MRRSKQGTTFVDRLIFQQQHRFVGQVVKVSASSAADSGFDSRLRRGHFSRSSHTSDLKIGTPVATLPSVWRYRVSTGTDWTCVRILWPREAENLIFNFHLTVAARKLVWADPSLRYSSMLLGKIKERTHRWFVVKNQNHLSKDNLWLVSVTWFSLVFRSILGSSGLLDTTQRFLKYHLSK